MEKEEQRIECGTRDEWRSWLEKNHLNKSKIALIVHKKHTGKPSLTHKESMEEAICFGWIDTTLKRLDEDTYIRRFSRRTDKSNWSRNTLKYAKQLIKQGKMAPEGLRRYKQGLRKKPLDHGRVKNPETPHDLQRELAKNNLSPIFVDLPPSYRRTYLYWLEKAKRPETRVKRIKSILIEVRNRKKASALKE